MLTNPNSTFVFCLIIKENLMDFSRPSLVNQTLRDHVTFSWDLCLTGLKFKFWLVSDRPIETRSTLESHNKTFYVYFDEIDGTSNSLCYVRLPNHITDSIVFMSYLSYVKMLWVIYCCPCWILCSSFGVKPSIFCLYVFEVLRFSSRALGYWLYVERNHD